MTVYSLAKDKHSVKAFVNNSNKLLQDNTSNNQAYNNICKMIFIVAIQLPAMQDLQRHLVTCKFFTYSYWLIVLREHKNDPNLKVTQVVQHNKGEPLNNLSIQNKCGVYNCIKQPRHLSRHFFFKNVLLFKIVLINNHKLIAYCTLFPIFFCLSWHLNVFILFYLKYFKICIFYYY